MELRFDAGHSPNLPEPVRERLLRLAGRRAGGQHPDFGRRGVGQLRLAQALLDLLARGEGGIDLQALAEASDGFSGAEIEQMYSQTPTR